MWPRSSANSAPRSKFSSSVWKAAQPCCRQAATINAASFWPRIDPSNAGQIRGGYRGVANRQQHFGEFLFDPRLAAPATHVTVAPAFLDQLLTMAAANRAHSLRACSRRFCGVFFSFATIGCSNSKLGQVPARAMMSKWRLSAQTRTAERWYQRSSVLPSFPVYPSYSSCVGVHLSIGTDATIAVRSRGMPPNACFLPLRSVHCVPFSSSS